MSEENRTQLLKKLLNIQAALAKVKPDGKNTNSNYKFISSNQLLELLNELMVQNAILVIPSVLANNTEQAGQTKSGIPVYRSTVSMGFEIVDCETGYSINKEFAGADTDSQGKEHAQAITQAHKRFYLKLFHIAEDNADPDSKDVHTSAPAKPASNEVTYTPVETAGPDLITDEDTGFCWKNTGKEVPKDYWTDQDKELLGGKNFFPKKLDSGQWVIGTYAGGEK